MRNIGGENLTERLSYFYCIYCKCKDFNSGRIGKGCDIHKSCFCQGENRVPDTKELEDLEKKVKQDMGKGEFDDMLFPDTGTGYEFVESSED